MRHPEQSTTSPKALEAAQQLGQAIRLARLARNFTMEDFAARGRMSLITLSRIERGDVSVGFAFWLAALEAGSLLHLVKRLADPSVDPAGEAQRKLEERKRASRKSASRKKRPRAAREHGYDF